MFTVALTLFHNVWCQVGDIAADYLPVNSCWLKHIWYCRICQLQAATNQAVDARTTHCIVRVMVLKCFIHVLSPTLLNICIWYDFPFPCSASSDLLCWCCPFVFCFFFWSLAAKQISLSGTIKITLNLELWTVGDYRLALDLALWKLYWGKWSCTNCTNL